MGWAEEKGIFQTSILLMSSLSLLLLLIVVIYGRYFTIFLLQIHSLTTSDTVESYIAKGTKAKLT